MTSTAFDRLNKAFQQGGIDDALAQLAAHLRVEKKYHELFEVRKMQLRRKHDLPLMSPDSSQLAGELRDEFEKGLLDACREVGMLLLRNYQIREGWMYLRAVDDPDAVRDTLSELSVPDDRREELVELLFQEGLDPVRGYQLLLDQNGTCNAITALDGRIGSMAPEAQTATAGALINHLYSELISNVRSHIERQEETAPADGSLRELIQERPWLTEGGNYHVDTSHLSSVVRLARHVHEETSLRYTLDFCAYGKQLDDQLQYPGTAPFEQLYESHELYYSALLDERTDEAIEYFREKANSTDAYYEGTQAAEVYVELLMRCGRGEESIAESVRLLPPGTHTTGLAPSLLELSTRFGNFDAYLQACEDQDDILGYVSGLALRQSSGDDPINTK